MTTRYQQFVRILLLTVALPVYAHQTPELVFEYESQEKIGDKEPVTAMSVLLPKSDSLAAFGEQLFHSNALSSQRNASCNSCHDLANAGTDGLKTPKLIGNGVLIRNTPTLYNVAHYYWFNMDGRHRRLEQAVNFCLTNDSFMNLSVEEAEQRVRTEPSLKRQLPSQATDTPIVVKALADFIRTLTTPGAPFDRVLDGSDEGAISADAREGYNLFKGYGCIACHNGINLGGNLLQKNHVVDDYFLEHPEANEDDLGRYEFTGDDYDKYVFRVPTLRNIELTGPYFHDGSAETLEHAIEEMGEHQLGIDLTVEEKRLIEEFLKTLTSPVVEVRQ